MPISTTARTWTGTNISNRNTIEDFTEEIDEARRVREHNFFHLLTRMLCLCLALMNLLLGAALPSSSFVTMAVSTPHCVVKSDRWSPDDDGFLEDYYYEALAFFRHSINQELDEETMRPEKATEAPRNSGTDPSTVKMKQWYQKQDRLSDKSQWQWSSNRVSDKKAPTGTERASYQVREPIEDYDERLVMRRRDMPSPVPERVANPKIREDRAAQDFRQNSEKMHRATSEDAYTKAWFDDCRSIFPQSVRKAGPDVDFYNVSTYQCSILFNNTGSFNRKSEFRKAENIDIQMKSSSLPTILSCHFSQNSWETTTHM